MEEEGVEGTGLRGQEAEKRKDKSTLDLDLVSPSCWDKLHPEVKF